MMGLLCDLIKYTVVKYKDIQFNFVMISKW